jgi:CHAT domain-containing protein
LDFDATIDSQSVSQNPADLSGEAEELFIAENRLLNDIKDRGMIWGYLYGTLSEVKKIYDILKKNRIATVLYTDKKGTESSFKNLSGKDIDMIHIATHGFYVKNDTLQSEDRQMERSGITFVGANNAKAKEGSPNAVDNGILTAAEISRLDFRGVDLVVLSACQTGLGDVSSEGVWGLQRGLKKAGVQSILMTLWTVDDNATQLLMTEFYRNLVSGKSKHDALEQAKLFVRTYKDGRYADEKYWAGFILLDAIN